MKTAPSQPDVTVPRHRKVAAIRREGVTLHWRDLASGDVTDGWVTSPVRTVIDCCLDLPFAEALAVFDSSWRCGLNPSEVQLAARALPPRQGNKVLLIASVADPRAANPFESVLRAISLSVPGLNVEPQLEIRDRGFFARVDLADPELKIVLEADSFEFHASRKGFAADCQRYNALSVRDWLVLRFSWEQVMFEPETVAATLRAAVLQQRERMRRRRPRPADSSTGTRALLRPTVRVCGAAASPVGRPR